MTQLRRATGTIQYGHLDVDFYDDIHDYWERLPILAGDDRITAGAFALERGEKTGRVHIQFYIEFRDRLRTQTLRSIFDLFEPKHEQAFRRVINAQGSWNYCVGEGPRYQDKDAIDRYQFGNPILYGSSDGPGKLQDLVNMVIEGDSLTTIMKADPYAWAVHRTRIVPFFHDWNGNTDLR